MTCDDCTEIQEDPRINQAAFVRIEEANVMVIGCRKHIKILIEQLRLAAGEEINKKDE